MSVHEATDEDQAIDLLRGASELPDVILAYVCRARANDRNSMATAEAVASLRSSDPRLASIPIILISGSAIRDECRIVIPDAGFLNATLLEGERLNTKARWHEMPIFRAFALSCSHL